MEDKQITAFFFTHQDRLRTSIMRRFDKILGRNQIDMKAQFFNGCILYLKIFKDDKKSYIDQWKFELSMVYSGDPAARKTSKKYFTLENTGNPNDIVFQNFPMYLKSKQMMEYFHINQAELDMNTIYNLFFMRHGQAQHNVKVVYNPRINTDLTSAGENQARDAGNSWAKWAQQNDITSINYFCVSDLIRTQQTAAMFLFGVRSYTHPSRNINGAKFSTEANVRFNPIEEINIIPNKEELNADYEEEEKLIRPHLDVNMGYLQRGEKIYNVPFINTDNLKVIVLPCLHELEKGQDDGSISSYGLGHLTSALTLGTTSGVVSRENITNCRNKNYGKRFYEASGITTRDCSNLPSVTNPETIKTNLEDGINIGNSPIRVMDWNFYNKFYKGYRDQISFGGRDHCGKTHFIGLFFQILKQEQIPQSPPSHMSSVDRGTGGGGPVQQPVQQKTRTGWFTRSKSHAGGGYKHKKTRKSKKSNKTRKNKKNNKQGKR
jgi:hypothetical protein